jgi:hypothetical protein
MKRTLLLVLMVLAAGPPAAYGRPKKLAAIDLYCERLKTEFLESAPVLFVGPDPWTELEKRPDSIADDVLASVYAEGLKIRWVVLQIAGPNRQWSETVSYFFDKNDLLVKRERYLDQRAANIAFEEIRYYTNGEVLTERTHHHALGPGRQDSSQFDDPDAPDFLAVDDLPFPKSVNLWRQLASTRRRRVNRAPDRHPRAGLRYLPSRPTNAPAQG